MHQQRRNAGRTASGRVRRAAPASRKPSTLKPREPATRKPATRPPALTGLDNLLRHVDRLLIVLTGLLLTVGAIAAAVVPGEISPQLPQLTGLPSPTPLAAAREYHGIRPTSMEIPSIGLNAPLVPIEVDANGVLNPPESLSEVGWWKLSARAGADRGQTVVTGHSASRAEGVMDDLPKVVDGAKVIVHTRDGGRVLYRVTGQVELNHVQLANRAQRLFGQQRPTNRLVMVTCSDYQNGVWRKNTIVFADPVQVERR